MVGCTNGCSYCWARRQAKRQKHNCKKCYDFVPHLHPERLDEPLKKRDPFVIGAVFMGDLFDPAMPDSARDEVFGVMAATAQHTFVVLTKQPAGACRYFDLSTDNREEDIGAEALRLSGGKHSGLVELPLPNLVLGVSITDQESADRLIPELLECPAATRIVSIEPMLGPVDIYPHICAARRQQRQCGAPDSSLAGYCHSPCDPCEDFDAATCGRLDGVILGGETGPGAVPMHPDWVRSVRDQCAEARVPFYFKQWGEWQPVCDIDILDPAAAMSVTDRRYIEMPHANGIGMARVGRKAAGRILDGRTHDALAWPQQ